MILNSYISEQLAVARRHDLQEAAERERLARQAGAHDRPRFQPRALRSGVRWPRPVDSSLCASAPRIATS